MDRCVMEWRRESFTLVELLAVIFIVAILAAVAIPILRGRIDAAKWTEGKAMAGTIASAIRAYAAGSDETGNWTESDLGLMELGISSGDRNGAYFTSANFTWQVQYDGINLSYIVTISRPAAINSPAQIILDSATGWRQ